MLSYELKFCSGCLQSLNNHSKINTFNLTFAEQFQNIIKLISCDLPFLILINIFNRDHQLVHLIIFSDYLYEVFFRNRSELILGLLS
jgi:hypothetical protein